MTDYRYSLRRSGWLGAGRLAWVMLNPSTADDHVDDPTIRRVTRFTRDAGYGDLVVVNLFAARATDPAALATMRDPIGPLNDIAIDTALADAAAVVFAWGASAATRTLAATIGRRSAAVQAIAAGLGLRPVCLGVTGSGAPRHPLYVRADQPLLPYELKVAS